MGVSKEWLAEIKADTELLIDKNKQSTSQMIKDAFKDMAEAIKPHHETMQN
jgi:hypothetical protein